MARGRRRTAKRQKGRNRLLEEKLQIGKKLQIGEILQIREKLQG